MAFLGRWRGVSVLCLVFAAVARAQDDTASDDNLGEYASQYEEEAEAPKIAPHPDMKAAFVFPDFDKPHFPMGESVDMLAAFMNTGTKTFNITEVAGTLNSPVNFAFVVQNFTRQAVNMALRPNEERSVLYEFTPDGRLEALDFQLCLTALYTDEQGAEYQTVLFNGTATLVESSSETSAKIMFVLGMLSVIAAIGGFIAYKQWVKYDLKNKKKAKKAEAAAAARAGPQLSDEWLAGIPGVSTKEKKKAAGSKPSSAGSKKRS